MIRALIIEDEIIAAKNLQRLIRSVDGDIDILQVCESISEAVAWLEEHSCDIIFQDIQLADGLSFQIFEHIEVETPIIFTTAFDQYAIQAFKQNSVDYLLKPIDKDALADAINKFKRLNQSETASSIDYAQIAALMKRADYKERFLIKIGSKYKTINIEDVAYFYVQDKVCHARTYENRSYPLDLSMTALTTKVDPKKYFRINRQLLVSHQAVQSLNYLSSSRVKVDLNPKYEDAIVAIEKIVPFKHWLDS